MATTKQLSTGARVTVKAGIWGGRRATVIDPKAAPKGHPRHRCVLLDIDEVGEAWVLPRLLYVGDLTQPEVTAPVDSQSAAALVTVVDNEPITDPMDPIFDRFRPDPSVVDQYVSRILPGGLRDLDALLTYRDERENGFYPNIALVGETQSGKTMLVRALAVLAARRDGLPKPYPVFTLNGSLGVTTYEMFGQSTSVEVNGVERIVWMEGIVPMALRCGGFLYLDEWNAVNPAMATALHPVLDDRREFTNTKRAIPDGHGGWMPEVVKAHPNTWIITTVNPGYKGTQTMAEASTNRFRWFVWDYDAATEETLVPSPTARLLGNALREARNDRSVTVPVGTSALIRLCKDAAQFGAAFALWSFTSMFPPSERPRVRYIIEDSGVYDMLNAEYPPKVPETPVDNEPF